MVTQENPDAGKGSVVLDIGGDIGALVVLMPPSMEALEVEIVPSGTDRRGVHVHRDGPDHKHNDGSPAHDHSHDHGRGHGHGHSSDHDATGDGHRHGAGAPPHVAVVPRTTPSGAVVHSLVFGALAAGRYDLYVRPDGPVTMTASVIGGQVTESRWPGN